MNKKEIINSFKKSELDTGSSAVQIALKTAMIKDLSEHVRKHKKDKHSQRGLLQAVSARKKMIQYLKRKNEAEYKKVIEALGLRK